VERNFDHNVIGSEHLLDRLTRAPGIPGGDRNCYAAAFSSAPTAA